MEHKYKDEHSSLKYCSASSRNPRKRCKRSHEKHLRVSSKSPSPDSGNKRPKKSRSSRDDHSDSSADRRHSRYKRKSHSKTKKKSQIRSDHSRRKISRASSWSSADSYSISHQNESTSHLNENYKSSKKEKLKSIHSSANDHNLAADSCSASNNCDKIKNQLNDARKLFSDNLHVPVLDRRSISNLGSQSIPKINHKVKDDHNRYDHFRHDQNSHHNVNSDRHDVSHSLDAIKEKKEYNKYPVDCEVNEEEKNCADDSVDSEEEITFEWDRHKWELNQMFFQDHDIIKRGTEEYQDFFKFLSKYQAIQKQKKLQEIINKKSTKKNKLFTKQSNQTKSTNSSRSDTYDLPLDFNSRYTVNFALKGDSVDAVMRRLPPLDLDEKNNRLPRRKVEEFKNIILLYLNFVQKQNFEKLMKLRACQRELPIAQYRQQIVSTVADNSIVLIAGDTGCGKSTQVRPCLFIKLFVNKR